MEEEEREEEGVSVVNESIILVPRGCTRVLTEGKLRWGMGAFAGRYRAVAAARSARFWRRAAAPRRQRGSKQGRREQTVEAAGTSKPACRRGAVPGLTAVPWSPECEEMRS